MTTKATHRLARVASPKERLGRPGRQTGNGHVEPAGAAESGGLDVREIPVKLIDSPPGNNPRQDFDEPSLRDLAASIRDAGLLQPIVIRPVGKRFELVAGERRLRAVQLLGRPAIAATVRELDDCQAAEIRLLENLDRADLNPLEEAAALRQLQDLGHDLQSLTKLLRRTEAAVKGRLILLTLPETWQEHVRKNRISAAAGEYLVPWIKYPRVLAAMEPAVECWPMPLTAWRRKLVDVVLSLSRNMDADAPDGPQFEPTGEDLDRLDVLEFDSAPGGPKLRRAMNAGIWDALQDKAAVENWEASQAGSGQSKAGSRKSPADRADGNGGEGLDEEPADADAESEFWERLAAFKREWLTERIVARLDAADLADLDELAITAGLDVAGEWRLSREFLELFAGERLRDLAADLDVDISGCRSDVETVAVLLHAAPDALPSAFFDVNQQTAPAAAEA